MSMVGEAHSLKVEKVLFQGKSDYQNVMVFQVILIIVLFPPKAPAIRCLPLLIMGDESVSLFSIVVIYVRQGARAGWSDSSY